MPLSCIVGVHVCAPILLGMGESLNVCKLFGHFSFQMPASEVLNAGVFLSHHWACWLFYCTCVPFCFSNLLAFSLLWFVLFANSLLDAFFFVFFFLNVCPSYHFKNYLCLLLQGFMCFLGVGLVKYPDQFCCCLTSSGKQNKSKPSCNSLNTDWKKSCCVAHLTSKVFMLITEPMLWVECKAWVCFFLNTILFWRVGDFNGNSLCLEIL